MSHINSQPINPQSNLTIKVNNSNQILTLIVSLNSVEVAINTQNNYTFHKTIVSGNRKTAKLIFQLNTPEEHEYTQIKKRRLPLQTSDSQTN